MCTGDKFEITMPMSNKKIVLYHANAKALAGKIGGTHHLGQLL
jgi:hypothetical protein